MVQRTALVFLGFLAITACKKADSNASPSASVDPSKGVVPAAGESEKGADLLGGGFEGELAFKITDSKKKDQKPIDITLHVKKDKVRIDLPEQITKEASKMMGPGNIYALLHTGEKKAYAVLEGTKEAIMVDLDKSAEQIKSMTGQRSAPAAAPGAPPDLSKIPKITKTGKKAKIAGMECEDWEFKSQDKPNTAVVCIAETDTSWLKLPTKLLPEQMGAMVELMDGKHLPLRLVAFEGTTEIARVEATKFEKKTVPDADVNVPSGYKITDMMDYITKMRTAAMGGRGVPPGARPASGTKPAILMPPAKGH